MNSRTAVLERKSRETEIKCELNVDGTGKTKIKTHIGILDHMLDLFAFHGYFDLRIDVMKADIEIDIHHTNEDVGIVLGKAFKKALDDKTGIRRFGCAFAPMEYTLGRAVVDLSGRGYLTFKVAGSLLSGDKPPVLEQDNYSFSYLEHFLESFAHNLGATIHITIENPSENLHTNIETVFKSLGLALDEAVKVDSRRPKDVPSTKGIID